LLRSGLYGVPAPVWARDFLFFFLVQNCRGADRAFCTVSTRVKPPGRAVDNHPFPSDQETQREWKCNFLPLLPPFDMLLAYVCHGRGCAMILAAFSPFSKNLVPCFESVVGRITAELHLSGLNGRQAIRIRRKSG
jgi:hypothetical protein